MYLSVQLKVLKWADKVASTCIRRPEDEFFWGEGMDDQHVWVFTKFWGIRLPKDRIYIDMDAAQLKWSHVMRRIEETLVFDAKQVAARDTYKTIVRRGAPELIVFEADTGEKVCVDRKQIKNMGIREKDLGEFEIRIIDRRSPIGFFRDGELVACVLPVRVNDEEI